MINLLALFFGGFRWYRQLVGGTWVFVSLPTNSQIDRGWFHCSDDSDIEYLRSRNYLIERVESHDKTH